jgi:pullulanase-type alpha-1,6-glucosidase
MMRKLMVDSVVTWAVQYKVDAFRFDLMGHHMVADMQAVREALDALTLEADGVDGKRIYLYGEGWNFGEVADNARGVNATQANMAGTGVGTFNDRLRDAVRGGTPFDGQTEQGFINGLYYDANDFDQGTEEAQLERLLQFSDLIRVGLAGNLRNYWLMPQNGRRTTASGIDYNDSPAAYTDDPQENIIYISKHDNETLFDIIQYKAPLDSTMDERVRMQNMGLSIVALSQGVPFFQAGSDMLRSKSLDRNSYNSGDWFNRLDFSYETNNWAVGLPPAADNQDMWPLMATILSSEGLTPDQDHILRTVAHFQEMLQIRQSSPLFRLQTADQVSDRLVFHNTGPFQQPGLIVMSLSDSGGENLDANYGLIVVLFNANDEAQQFTEALFTDLPLSLHPVQQSSADAVVQTAAFAPSPATFTVPGRTTAVFVLAEADTPSELVAPEPEPTPEPTLAPTPEPTDEPAPEATAEPAEEESVTATAVPLIESEPAAEETESDEPNSALPWVIGGGVLLAAGAGYVLTRRKN